MLTYSKCTNEKKEDIKEYLKNRNQRVVINGKFSTLLEVKSGVPQGSILGPLLFILFINDMQTKVSENTNIALYADDTKIWRRIKSPEDHLKIILYSSLI